MKIRFSRSLGFYLFLTFLFFAFLPLAVFQITSYNRAKQTLERNTETQISQIILTARRLYKERMANEKASLAFLTGLPSLDKDFLSHYFYQYHDLYYRISLLDSNGSPHFSLVSNFDPQYLFPHPFEERIDLPGIRPDRLPQDERIHSLDIYPVPDGYALPLICKSGENYLLADIRLSVFLFQIESLLTLPSRDQFIVADQRKAVIYSRNPGILNQYLNIPGNRFIREKAAITGFASSEDGFLFGVKKDYQYLLDSINRSIRLNLSLGLGGVLLIFLLAYIFVKPLTSPLSQLVKAADGIAEGNFDLKTNIRHPEEFKILGERFNRMAMELKILLEEKSRTQNFNAIGKFASYFAHDIKSPLEGTYLIASEIHRNMKSGDPQRENMAELLNGITRLRDLVRQSLEFSRLSNLRLEPVDMNQLISSKASEFLKQFSCRMELHLEPELKPLNLDPVLFSRVLDNLFRNSLEAADTEKDCLIRIKTREENNRIVLTVGDNGRGIEADKIEKVFEPFYSSKKKGSGFGLAFVQEVIRKHGGRIEVDSKPRKGTAMTLILPGRIVTEE